MKDIVEEVNYEGIEDVKHMFDREKAEQTDGLKDIKRMYVKADRGGRTREQRRFKTCLRRITNRS